MMNWLRTMKMASKLYLGIGLIIVIFCGGAVYQIEEFGMLGELQDQGAKRGRDLSAIQEVEVHVQAMYGIIADAVINRDLAESAKEFQQAKAVALRDIDLTKATADTAEERQWAEQFATAYGEYMAAFEREQLPELEKGAAASVDEIRRIDGIIDGLREKTTNPLMRIADSLTKESTAGDELYDHTRDSTIKVAVGVCIAAFLFASLFTWLLIRNILGQLGGDPAEVVAIVRRVAVGDLTKAIAIRGQDEGSLIVAMQRMVEALSPSSRSIAMGMVLQAGGGAPRGEGRGGRVSPLPASRG